MAADGCPKMADEKCNINNSETQLTLISTIVPIQADTGGPFVDSSC
jgi:hypothetical protein